MALLGRPNVGKSTLLNALLGEKIAPTTPKPQTTRHRLRGILTTDKYQIVFIDTPGYHRPTDELGRRMMASARGAAADADVTLVVVDSTDVRERDAELVNIVAASGKAYLVALNKTDLSGSDEIPPGLGGFEFIPISALTGEGLDRLLERLVELLPVGPRYYDADQLTAEPERELVGEFVREQAMVALREELPYALEVVVDEFEERSEDLVYIAATLYVERKSQVGIVVGTNGSVLRGIGSQARRTIESFLARRVYLDLRVKVRPKWRRDSGALTEFGYVKAGG